MTPADCPVGQYIEHCLDLMAESGVIPGAKMKPWGASQEVSSTASASLPNGLGAVRWNKPLPLQPFSQQSRKQTGVTWPTNVNQTLLAGSAAVLWGL